MESKKSCSNCHHAELSFNLYWCKRKNKYKRALDLCEYWIEKYKEIKSDYWQDYNEHKDEDY